MERLYRLNVAGIFVDAKGKMLVAERNDFPGSWQFPQGGVDTGESLEEAFRREMEEELGISAGLYEIVERRGGYRYAFPPGHRKREIYTGQEQTYFRCDFVGDPARVRVDTAHPEFRSVRWIEPEEFQEAWLPDFKRAVYRQVMRDFFGLEWKQESGPGSLEVGG